MTIRLTAAIRNQVIDGVIRQLKNRHFDTQLEDLMDAGLYHLLGEEIRTALNQESVRKLMSRSYAVHTDDGDFVGMFWVPASWSDVAEWQKDAIKAAVQSQKHYMQAYAEIMALLAAVLDSCSSSKQVRERYPFLIPYLPEEPIPEEVTSIGGDTLLAKLKDYGWEEPLVL